MHLRCIAIYRDVTSIVQYRSSDRSRTLQQRNQRHTHEHGSADPTEPEQGRRRRWDGPGGPFMGHGRMRGRRGGPGGGRRARRGDVRAAVLALLAERPMHGYEMIQELEERTNGMWRPSPGAVYPALQLLDDQGLVRSVDLEGKRRYELTDAGRAEVPERAPWEDVAQRRRLGAPPALGRVRSDRGRDEAGHRGRHRRATCRSRRAPGLARAVGSTPCSPRNHRPQESRPRRPRRRTRGTRRRSRRLPTDGFV